MSKRHYLVKIKTSNWDSENGFYSIDAESRNEFWPIHDNVDVFVELASCLENLLKRIPIVTEVRVIEKSRKEPLDIIIYKRQKQ